MFYKQLIWNGRIQVQQLLCCLSSLLIILPSYNLIVSSLLVELNTFNIWYPYTQQDRFIANGKSRNFKILRLWLTGRKLTSILRETQCVVLKATCLWSKLHKYLGIFDSFLVNGKDMDYGQGAVYDLWQCLDHWSISAYHCILVLQNFSENKVRVTCSCI